MTRGAFISLAACYIPTTPSSVRGLNKLEAMLPPIQPAYSRKSTRPLERLLRLPFPERISFRAPKLASCLWCPPHYLDHDVALSLRHHLALGLSRWIEKTGPVIRSHRFLASKLNHPVGRGVTQRRPAIPLERVNPVPGDRHPPPGPESRLVRGTRTAASRGAP